jgi:ubiquinone/menaquinone biosynthesis C-methylase UbiE
MNEKTISYLRFARQLGQQLLEPMDSIARRLNNRRNYPPLWIRQLVGNLNDYEGSVGEYTAYLKLLCNLQPGDTLLDIGCGCGTILTPVTEQKLSSYLGGYIGLDMDQRLLRSAQTRSSRSEMFLSAEHICHVVESSIDVVLCKSLFTHLLLPDTVEYLEHIRRVLRSGGRCLSTWFLLRKEDYTHPLRGRYTFPYRENKVAYQRESKPTLAVAYSLEYLKKLLKDMKLNYDIYFGAWRGEDRGLSFQDIIVITKP